VYARASGVLIWLGPETEDSVQALCDLESLSEDKHFRELSFYGQVDTESGAWTPAPASRVDPLENLMKRSYWSRMWVVQEIVRSRKATLLCGSSSIDWKTCLKVRDNWPKHSRTCCNDECALIEARMRRVMNWLNSSWKKYSSNDTICCRHSIRLAVSVPRTSVTKSSVHLDWWTMTLQFLIQTMMPLTMLSLGSGQPICSRLLIHLIACCIRTFRCEATTYPHGFQIGRRTIQAFDSKQKDWSIIDTSTTNSAQVANLAWVRGFSPMATCYVSGACI